MQTRDQNQQVDWLTDPATTMQATRLPPSTFLPQHISQKSSTSGWPPITPGSPQRPLTVRLGYPSLTLRNKLEKKCIASKFEFWQENRTVLLKMLLKKSTAIRRILTCNLYKKWICAAKEPKLWQVEQPWLCKENLMSGSWRGQTKVGDERDSLTFRPQSPNI